MDEIGHYLNRYKNLTPPEASIKKIISEAIREICGIIVPEKEIMVRGTTAYLSCHPAKKGEIRLHSVEILTHINSTHTTRISALR